MSRMKKRLKKAIKGVLKPLLPVMVIALLLGLLMVGIYSLTGLLDWVPSYEAPVVGAVAPSRVVFGVSFLVGLVVAGSYYLYRINKERAHDHWGRYSTWAKSTLLGTASAIVVTGVLAIGYAANMLEFPVVVLGAALTWPTVVGAVLLAYRRSSRSDSLKESLATAYVLTKGLESRTLSIIIGLLVAVGGGLIVDVLGSLYTEGWPLWPSVLCASLLWIVVTLFTYNRYEKTTVERANLTIIDLNSPESRDGRELVLKNTSGRTVPLAESLIQDTDLSLYRPDFDYQLKPGQYGSLEIADEFSLEPNDEAIELPLGYDLKQGGETPAIYTPNNEVHHLQWTEEAAAVIDRESTKHVDEVTDTDRTTATARTKPLSESGVDPTPQD
ncbi:hypothetical protein [Halomicrobium katesii]|uniref:hypothetical protein n=1 Tax=Halomicrobium katesii TaxID=437163 RepID=UPI00036235CB|nr:hypothetical protein [Halomicrobium katesii]